MRTVEDYLSKMERDGRKNRSGGRSNMDITVQTERLTLNGRKSSCCIIARRKEERMGQRPATFIDVIMETEGIPGESFPFSES